eukprot:2175249-Prymnesium_polylepis.1
MHCGHSPYRKGAWISQRRQPVCVKAMGDAAQGVSCESARFAQRRVNAHRSRQRGTLVRRLDTPARSGGLVLQQKYTNHGSTSSNSDVALAAKLAKRMETSVGWLLATALTVKTRLLAAQAAQVVVWSVEVEMASAMVELKGKVGLTRAEVAGLTCEVSKEVAATVDVVMVTASAEVQGAEEAREAAAAARAAARAAAASMAQAVAVAAGTVQADTAARWVAVATAAGSWMGVTTVMLAKVADATSRAQEEPGVQQAASTLV